MTTDRMSVLAAICAKYDDGGGEAEQLRRDTSRRLEWRRRRGGKVCARCSEGKPLRAFGADASRRDGLAVYCRECRSAARL